MFLCALTVNAQDVVRYVTANLNMRYEPNTTSAVITVIPKGTAVTIDEDCDCKWIPVSYNGYIGYVSTNICRNTRKKPSVPCRWSL